MKLLPLVLFLLFIRPGIVTAQTPPDAVAADPDHHVVIIDNDHVRVYRAIASPGAESPMHTHPPTVIVSLGQARYELRWPDGTTSIMDLAPGQVFWLKNPAHGWQLLAGDSHLIGIEVKAAASGAPVNVEPLPDTDAVVRDPAHHQVVFENEHVRVIEALVAPGATSPRHTHPPTVAIHLLTFRARVEVPGRDPMILDGLPGEVLWYGAGGEHAWELLAGTARVIAIEIKAARETP